MTKIENIAMKELRDFFDYLADGKIEIREMAGVVNFYKNTSVGKKLVQELFKFLSNHQELIFEFYNYQIKKIVSK
jgi:hypothetical protein